ncbi:MAG: AMP-binding protein, partial [Phycisphaeraceae bacterium]|nr:AMP-binding protein [Phycisphaeraceae bacterium]
MSRVSLWSRLLEDAGRDPDRIAFHFPDLDLPPLSVGRWARAASALCLRLRSGQVPDGPVGLMAPNGPAFVIGFAATLLADRPLLPLSPHLTDHELHTALRRAGVTFLIAPSRRRAALKDPAPSGLDLEQVASDGEPGASQQVGRLHAGGGHLYLQSSGTTGLPKIVSRSQESLNAVAVNCAEAVGFDRGRVLGALPACHSYGVEHLLLAPLVGGAEVWMMRRFEPIPALRLLRGERITLFPGVPFMFESLVRAADADEPLADLRAAYSAGGPLPDQTRRDFEKTFGVRLGQLYGATEIGSVTYADPSDRLFDPASVGRPMDRVQIRVADVAGSGPQPTVAVETPGGRGVGLGAVGGDLNRRRAGDLANPDMAEQDVVVGSL